MSGRQAASKVGISECEEKQGLPLGHLLYLLPLCPPKNCQC